MHSLTMARIPDTLRIGDTLIDTHMRPHRVTEVGETTVTAHPFGQPNRSRTFSTDDVEIWCVDHDDGLFQASPARR